MPDAHPILDPRNLVRSILSLVIVAALGSALFEILKDPDWSKLWRPTLFGISALVLLAVLHSPAVRRFVFNVREPLPPIVEPLLDSKARALIALVSVGAGRSSTVEAAMAHHPILEELWLFTSRASQPDSDQVMAELAQKYPSLKVTPVFLEDVYSIPLVKGEVEHVRKKLRQRFAEGDIICDFTGMTKSASAGMIFACAPRGVRLQYMHPKQVDANGRAVVEAGSYPMEVKIAYRLDEDF